MEPMISAWPTCLKIWMLQSTKRIWIHGVSICLSLLAHLSLPTLPSRTHLLSTTVTDPFKCCSIYECLSICLGRYSTCLLHILLDSHTETFECGCSQYMHFTPSCEGSRCRNLPALASTTLPSTVTSLHKRAALSNCPIGSTTCSCVIRVWVGSCRGHSIQPTKLGLLVPLSWIRQSTPLTNSSKGINAYQCITAASTKNMQ